MKKRKTIFDYVGILPDKGITIEEIREIAIEEAAKDRVRTSVQSNLIKKTTS